MEQTFEWNSDKALANLIKHDISFEEASTIFDDPMYIMFSDEEHSQGEERYITIGLSQQNRLVMVAHTERMGVIRIISARKATKHERSYYEEGL